MDAMSIDLSLLAESAAGTLAALAATEAWQTARDRVKRLFGGDAAAEQVVSAAEDPRHPALKELVEARLRQDEALAARLVPLLNELRPGAGPVIQTASADHGAVVIQAGRDVNRI